MARAFAVQYAGSLLQALQLTDRDIAAFINALRCHYLYECLHDGIPAFVHAQCQQLHYQHIAEPVDDQPRQKIRLAVYETVCVRSRQKPFPVPQAACKPFHKKCRIHPGERGLRYNSYPDL
ncbi:hypothetical protein D3C76_1515240 [compost metagenome]